MAKQATKATVHHIGKVEVVEPVERSFNGVRKALFEDWDKLRRSEISTDKARASSRMADSIINTVNTEITSFKIAKNYGVAPLLLQNAAPKDED